MRIKGFLLALTVLWATAASGAPLVRVVATVNNDAITSYQLDQRVEKESAGNQQLSADARKALRLKVLNAMIEDLLVEQRIHELGLTVSDQELDSAIVDVLRQNKLNREQLKTALKAQGMSFADYRQSLRKEILRYKLIGREVKSKVEVTNTQVRAYFDAHKQEYSSPPTLHLVHLSFALPKAADAKTLEKLQQQAQIARQWLLAGKTLPEVLKTLEGEAEGGDLGTLIEAEMNPKLTAMVKDLKPGEVSTPQKALGSIHLFQVLERTPAKAELTPKTRAAIEKILAARNSEQRFAEWKKELRKGAAIDIRL